MVNVLKEHKTYLVFLIVLAFIVRAFVFGGYLSKNERYLQVDSGYYHDVSVQIAHGEGLSNPDGSSSFYRLPGYSIFLAVYYLMFGVDKKNVLWTQVALASLIPALVMLLSLCLFPSFHMLARAVGLYSVFHLGLVMYSGFFMTETLFIFLLLIFMLLFFPHVHLWLCSRKDKKEKPRLLSSFFRDFCPEPICTSTWFIGLYDDVLQQERELKQEPTPQSWMLVLAGIVLGLASMVRPVGHYIIVLAIIMIIFSSENVIEKIRNSVGLVFGWLLIISPWLIRNYILAGSVFFHTLPGGHFLYLSAARVAMHVHSVSYWEARDLLSKEVGNIIAKQQDEQKKELHEVDKCRIHVSLAVEYFKKYPFLALKNWLTDIMRTCLSLYSSEIVFLESGRKEIDYFNKKRTIWSMFERYFIPQTEHAWLTILIWFEMVVFFIMLLGFIFGIGSWFVSLVSFKAIDTCIWFRVLPFVGLFIFISLSGGYARMRLPIEPLLAIMSLRYWFRKKSSL
jgi:4-amino-4-deoxy-L-arabinose transferase-like glycosyltransferase